MAPFLDSHLHLQDSRIETEEIAPLLKRAAKVEVGKFFCNATREKDWQDVLNLSKKYPQIIPFLGIHPWYVEECETGWQNRLADQLCAGNTGLGETGLDKRCQADFTLQKKIFQEQLEIAASLKLPLVVHCVKAWGSLISILTDFKKHTQLPTIQLHSYNGSLESTKWLRELNCYFSFSQRFFEQITPSQKNTFLQIPLQQILLETDSPDQFSPFFWPEYKNQTQNEPAFIIRSYEQAAKIHKIPLNTFRLQLWENGKTLTKTIVKLNN